MPGVRSREYFTELFGHHPRSEQALPLAIVETVVNGILNHTVHELGE